MAAQTSQPFRKPDWFTRNIFNKAVAWLTRLGVSVMGSRVLAVRGRSSGEWRSTPVNLLTFEGQRYLVAPRGETQWVRNLRVSQTGELHLGRQVESFTSSEVANDAKAAILRAYLARWKFEVGMFFDGVGPGSSDAELRRISPNHPIFLITGLL